LGPNLFKEVLHIKSKQEIVKKSLTFVIDVTGSMAGDIQGVKRATIDLVRESINSTYVPEKYILVTFSDPGSFWVVRYISAFVCEESFFSTILLCTTAFNFRLYLYNVAIPFCMFYRSINIDYSHVLNLLPPPGKVILGQA
jgi:hypothetical protein